MNTKLVGILTAFLMFGSILHSQTRPRESLRGLNGVYLYVLPVGKDVEAGGLSTSQIQKAVEMHYPAKGRQNIHDTVSSNSFSSTHSAVRLFLLHRIDQSLTVC
jgi:hypothetical protein